MGGALSRSARKYTVWAFTLGPLTLLYLYLALPFFLTHRPLSRVVDDPALGLLFDMALAAAPVIAALWLYVAASGRAAHRRRADFVASFAGADLMQARFNPNLVYQVRARGDDGGRGRIRVIWTADGECRNGRVYDGVDADGLAPFDRDRFLND